MAVLWAVDNNSKEHRRLWLVIAHITRPTKTYMCIGRGGNQIDTGTSAKLWLEIMKKKREEHRVCWESVTYFESNWILNMQKRNFVTLEMPSSRRVPNSSVRYSKGEIYRDSGLSGTVLYGCVRSSHALTNPHIVQFEILQDVDHPLANPETQLDVPAQENSKAFFHQWNSH
ncbi:hypothetical protein L211DRAFT_853772 [Terfezia boudieri ATCC MYA-4762]|uniref:Uncharacterized protein n=1 Tax=Terfezia boudieri ATCC MYA-4762 TaxID=1051890 RepID=A0A3N4L7H3_9PEZI|nr:hypothetical protein L211DRAFT_853772 [Terfezia boudieri ATCC MYA-4762]